MLPPRICLSTEKMLNCSFYLLTYTITELQNQGRGDNAIPQKNPPTHFKCKNRKMKPHSNNYGNKQKTDRKTHSFDI